MMPFDSSKWSAPARNGDVGGALLDLSIALSRIEKALTKLSDANGVDISTELAEIRKFAASAFDEFKDLTGWKQDAD